MRASLLLVGVGLLFVVSCSTTMTLPVTTYEVAQRTLGKDFTIVAKFANPTRGSQVYLSSGYDLKIRNDSAFAYLPYYGVAHVAPFNNTESGIKFSEKMLDYVRQPKRKNAGWNIQFNVKTQSSVLYFMLDVYNNGSSSIVVTLFEKDAITFLGEMRLDLK